MIMICFVQVLFPISARKALARVLIIYTIFFLQVIETEMPVDSVAGIAMQVALVLSMTDTNINVDWTGLFASNLPPSNQN